MKKLIVGVGGMTNGGKSTLSRSLKQKIPNSVIIAQDSFFKDDSAVLVDGNGFKQFDTLDALHMDAMMSQVDAWRRDPQAFLKETDQTANHVFVLIVEGFLIFNHRPLNQLMNKRYFLEVPYDICKKRRSLRVYKPPDPPGYFDGHVWPMYLRNRKEMESTATGICASQTFENIFGWIEVKGGAASLCVSRCQSGNKHAERGGLKSG